MKLPNLDNGESRLVTFDYWGYREAYILDHTDLGNGFFSINYTNAKSGRGVVRHAIVREGPRRVYKNGSYAEHPTERTWIPVARVDPAKVGGKEAFRTVVFAPEEHDYFYAWRNEVKHTDRITARRYMVGIWRVMYDQPAHG